MTTISRRECIKGMVFGGAALLAGSFSPWACAKRAPVAETLYGKVSGSSIEGVSIFRGIPYGGPTEGAVELYALSAFRRCSLRSCRHAPGGAADPGDEVMGRRPSYTVQ